MPVMFCFWKLWLKPWSTGPADAALKAFTGKSTAEVLEKFYPASAENIENDAFIL